MSARNPVQTALELFREHGGTLQTGKALRLGIHPRTLYALRDAGNLQQLSRGLYRLTELPLPAEPDLLVVAHQLPGAVICLVSALAFHGLTTQIPHPLISLCPAVLAGPRWTILRCAYSGFQA